MIDDFIGVDTTPLYRAETGKADSIHLLWGDGVQVLERGEKRTKVRVRGRRRFGYVDNQSLGGSSLLELYFIDVGQGDGILIKTPDFQHIMIDGGYPRSQQDVGKNAADFVDWKFYEDYGVDQIRLEAMISSHCDADHYGGLWDLLNVAQSRELDASDVQVKDFYHSGVGWWKRESGGRWLGGTVRRGNQRYLTQLMGDRQALAGVVAGGTGPQLQGWWGEFIEAVVGAGWADGRPTEIRRLSRQDAFLPGFEPDQSGRPAIHVFSPATVDLDGVPALCSYSGGDSQNTNGHSLLFRLDYGHTRILLNGDLNRKSQQAILADFEGRLDELACDVAKACHHGSEDVSFRFLQAMNPAVTIISSGDSEGYDHPRPAILAASAITGFQCIENDNLVSPLVYCTELARSTTLGRPLKLVERDEQGGAVRELHGDAFRRSTLHFSETKPGEFRPVEKKKPIDQVLVAAGLVYGLVNVRTDGEKILCAVLNEKDYSWNIRTIKARF